MPVSYTHLLRGLFWFPGTDKCCWCRKLQGRTSLRCILLQCKKIHWSLCCRLKWRRLNYFYRRNRWKWWKGEEFRLHWTRISGSGIRRSGQSEGQRCRQNTLHSSLQDIRYDYNDRWRTRHRYRYFKSGKIIEKAIWRGYLNNFPEEGILWMI